jgi:mRNA-degrading endonuclease RelE of RelBE toxin-antitoxin system
VGRALVIPTKAAQNDIKRLKRKYRGAEAELWAAFESLESDPHQGVLIPGVPSVRKVKIASRDIRGGKERGFRLITSWQQDRLYVMWVYAKPERKTVTPTEIRQRLERTGLL